MAEKILERGKEPEPVELIYEQCFRWLNERKLQKQQGTVVIRGKEQGWEQGRQGLIKYYTYPKAWETLGVPGWFIFLHDIRRHSGRHRHQGGLGLFILEGKGYTVVNGVRYDWEKDDLVLLPVMPNGCEHQHFNAEPGKPCLWMAMLFTPLFDAMGNELEQRAVSPDWQGTVGMPHVA